MNNTLACYIGEKDTLTFCKRSIDNVKDRVVEIVTDIIDLDNPEDSTQVSVVVSIEDLIELVNKLKED